MTDEYLTLDYDSRIKNIDKEKETQIFWTNKGGQNTTVFKNNLLGMY